MDQFMEIVNLLYLELNQWKVIQRKNIWIFISNYFPECFLFSFYIFVVVGIKSRDFAHAREVLYHWAMTPAPASLMNQDIFLLDL
jgi:hypothetical protein